MSMLLLIIMLAAGIAMSVAILLMAPKGGLGFGLGWAAAWSNEYGTKKSLEAGLKQVAMRAAIIFVVTALVYPFTKPKTYNAEAVINSGSTAPEFDLGWSTGNNTNVVNWTGN